MSKTCGECKYYISNEYSAVCIAFCDTTSEDRRCMNFEPPTVFDHITQSMETLAEKLVYERVIIKNTQINNSHSSMTRSSYIKMWKSALFPRKFFDDKQKAYAATMAELKKEWKG